MTLSINDAAIQLQLDKKNTENSNRRPLQDNGLIPCHTL